jgi:two-component sensor histidine kinase
MLLTLILYVSIGLAYLRRIDSILLEKIKETALENDLLLRELNHRTKNTLGLISSLISLQTDTLIEPVAVEAFQELRERVRTVTTVCKLLSREKRTNAADAGEYLKTLAAGLSESFALKKRGISITATSDYFLLPEDNLIHLGLIANELMTNAIKYAFPGDRQGSIRLSMKAQGADYILEVSDDGVGLDYPDTHQSRDFQGSQGLGLSLVDALAAQLHGKLETRTSPESGAAFLFSFPHPEFPTGNS